MQNQINDSGFGADRPKRRKMERHAEAANQNPLFNLAVKALNILSSALLAMGIWYIQDLKAEIKETRTDVRAAVVSINKIESSTNELQGRVRMLEDWRNDTENRSREVDRRVTTNETDIKHLQGRR